MAICWHRIIYNDYFIELSKEYNQFEYIPVASREPNLTDGFRKGYVTHMLEQLDVQGYKVYMCGSKKMVMDSYNILIAKGLTSDDIFYESEEKIKISDVA